MNTKPSFAGVTHALATLTDEELAALIDKPQLLKQFAGSLVADAAGNTFVAPLSDDGVPEKLRKTTAKWRKYAAFCGYTGPVAWKVKAGFTLKQHAPLAGPCYDKLNYLQGWNLKNDEATKDSIVFWVPRLVENSTSKTVQQMEAMRSELRKSCGLPSHHGTSFGSIALLFALILAHFKRTGERVPLQYLYAASDTLDSDGNRLIAGGFSEDGLHCYSWNELAYGDVGFFLLGVELGN